MGDRLYYALLYYILLLSGFTLRQGFFSKTKLQYRLLCMSSYTQSAAKLNDIKQCKCFFFT